MLLILVRISVLFSCFLFLMLAQAQAQNNSDDYFVRWLTPSDSSVDRINHWRYDTILKGEFVREFSSEICDYAITVVAIGVASADNEKKRNHTLSLERARTLETDIRTVCGSASPPVWKAVLGSYLHFDNNRLVINGPDRNIQRQPMIAVISFDPRRSNAQMTPPTRSIVETLLCKERFWPQPTDQTKKAARLENYLAVQPLALWNFLKSNSREPWESNSTKRTYVCGAREVNGDENWGARLLAPGNNG
ncbi:MAG: hypothetical protein AAGD92_13570 [Pseudomonadota bacterium]